MFAHVVGVDGCRAGWIACRINIDLSATTFAIYPTFLELMTHEATAQTIAVDIPMGMRSDWTPRACDSEAKSMLGPRRSSIFPAPPRSLLTFTTYTAANEKSQRLYARGISRQTFHLFSKILEVDSFLRGNSEPRVHEVHPELAFRMLAGSDLCHSKKTVAGYHERRQLLKRHGIDLPSSTDWRAKLHARRVQVQRDDVADAAAAAYVALRILHGKATTTPGVAEQDDFGIPMRIFF